MARLPAPAALAAFAIAALFARPAPADEAAAPLVPLVRGLPWSGVSGLIGYGPRLWFVNSVKFVNHNSADIYSYDPATGRARYERHLFSQDAGDPVVARGLLYWPFEDSRFSPGRGEFMVTDGRDWRWGLLPEGRAFHVHAMAGHQGALYAAPSAWRARLQRSDDGGTNWRQIFEYPSPRREVSRIVALESLNGALFGGLTNWGDRRGAKLLRWNGRRFDPVAGWPAGASVPVIKAYRGWLYGDNVTGEGGGGVWRTDGSRMERITALDGRNIRAFAAAPDALWAVSAHRGGGALWRSVDGVAWTRHQRYSGPRPLAVAVHGGRVYVGAEADDGGMLWGPPAPAPTGAAVAPGPLPRGRPPPAEPLADSLARLDRVLGDGARYGRLRGAALPLALRDDRPAGEAVSVRLTRPFPKADASMFGGSVRVSAQKMGRWYLLWAMAHIGHGKVPVGLISAPWTAPPNRAEKYLEAAPAAAWAAAQIGQDDDATIAALIARLDRPGDPPWIKGDMVGALTALTGRRFGHDGAAWRRWRARR